MVSGDELYNPFRIIVEARGGWEAAKVYRRVNKGVLAMGKTASLKFPGSA